MTNKLIGGVFRETEEANRAIRELKNKGYGKEDFSVFAKDKDEAKEIGKETNTEVTKESGERGKNAGKGLGIGAGTGGVLGGLTGLLLEIGLLAIPGIGAVAAAGPLAATLAGAGVGAAGGGLVGALTGAGIPEHHAKEYEDHLKKGHIIVLVEEKVNANDVYTTFMENDTQNTNMYPEEVVNHHNENRHNTSTGLGGAMHPNQTNDTNDNYTGGASRSDRGRGTDHAASGNNLNSQEDTSSGQGVRTTDNNTSTNDAERQNQKGRSDRYVDTTDRRSGGTDENDDRYNK